LKLEYDKLLSNVAFNFNLRHYSEGTRRNAHVLIEYLEGWLAGRGAKAIGSGVGAAQAKDEAAGGGGGGVAGGGGAAPVSPTLMEDLATARMSVAGLSTTPEHNSCHVINRALDPRFLNETSSYDMS